MAQTRSGTVGRGVSANNQASFYRYSPSRFHSVLVAVCFPLGPETGERQTERGII